MTAKCRLERHAGSSRPWIQWLEGRRLMSGGFSPSLDLAAPAAAATAVPAISAAPLPFNEPLSTGSGTLPRAAVRAFRATPLALPAVSAGQSLDVPVAQISGLPAGATPPVAIIHWGDGRATVLSATALSGSPGQFVAWAPHTYRHAGHFTATVAFRSDGRLLARAHERVTVVKGVAIGVTPGSGSDHQPGLTLPAITGVRFDGVLGTVSFPTAPVGTLDTTNTQVRIDWGDGSMSKGELSTVGTNQFQITGAHVYANPGTYAVHAIATYDHYPLIPIPGEPLPEFPQLVGAYAGLDATLDVSGAAVTLPPPSVQITGRTLPLASVNSMSGVTLATMTGISPDPLGADVYAVVDWGDGFSGSIGASTLFQNGQYVVTGYHVYGLLGNINQMNGAGAYSVKITLLLNDHVDSTKNTVLGSVTDQVTAP